LILIQGTVFAVAFTWIGSGDGSSWNDPANWDVGSGYPDDAGDTATIALLGVTVTVNETITVGSVTLNEATASVSLLPGNSLTVTNDLTITAGDLNVNAETLSVGGAVTGAVTGAGSLDGGTGTVSVTGNFTGISYTATSGTTSVGGDFAPGGFADNGGLVQFVDANPQDVTSNANSFFDVQISKTGGSIDFTDSVTINNDLIVDAAAYDIALSGGGTVTNAVTFANTGSLTIGAGFTFDGGVDTTGVGGTVTLNGTIETSDDAIVFGAVTLGSAVTVSTNATTTAGDVTVGAVTGGGNALTIETGNGVANADVSGTSVSGVTTLTLQNIGGTAAFSGDVSVDTLSVDNTVANASFTGAAGTVTNAVVFANTGTLELGQDGGTLTYNGGVSATAPSGITVAGTFRTSDDAMTLGDVDTGITLGADTALNTDTGAGDVSLGGAIDATTDLAQGLAVTSGTGSISLTGPIGVTHPLAYLQLNSSNAAGFDLPALELNSLTVVSGGPITDSGTLTVTNLASFKTLNDGGTMQPRLQRTSRSARAPRWCSTTRLPRATSCSRVRVRFRITQTRQQTYRRRT